MRVMLRIIGALSEVFSSLVRVMLCIIGALSEVFYLGKRTDVQKQDIIVIGAGASGLMAAISAAGRGASVTILDHHPVPGKKLLSTGNGKCNFTNQKQGIECYRSDDPAFVMHALEQFGYESSIAFFRDLGVFSRSRNGYYYPRSGQASTIRNALLMEAERLHVRIVSETDIQKIRKNNTFFVVQARGGKYTAEKCILATGGNAAPKTGSDGSGYLYAVQLGHTVQDPLPALVPLISGERWLKSTAGVRCDGTVSLLIDHKPVASDTGEIQMTEYGISGIPVFQVSRYASIALAEKKKPEALIDFLPGVSPEELRAGLAHLADHLGTQKNWYHILAGICNSKIAAMICKKLVLSEQPVLRLSDQTFHRQLDAVTSQLKQTRLTITGTRRMEQAQVTCGGVPLAEIGPDMQSKKVPGLYFAGEILNVDGICGGYNLQWAWTSGYLAGIHAGEKIKVQK